MSFCGAFKERVEEGDTIILYISFKSMYPLVVSKTIVNKAGQEVPFVYQTNYGALKVEDLIGKKFGTKVRLTRGYCYLLHPTPELWTKCLPHRTQILYARDISMVVMQLQLRPGSVVVESGTGSGSLSHSILRTIAPGGHLHTFDFHQQRTEMASKEFSAHGLGDLVTASHRDVCADGFGLDDEADAVFLDLPHPWLAVPHAKKALRKASGGRLCSFSPCVEQVQRTAARMREEGFTEIATMECLLREFQVRKITVPLYDHEYKKDQQASEDTGSGARKRKLEEDEEQSGDKDSGEDATADLKNEDDPQATSATKMQGKQETTFLTGLPLMTMPGHTGYLTFATLPPKLQLPSPPTTAEGNK